MIQEIKKSFHILIQNPYIMLLFITYILIIATAMPILYSQSSISKFALIALLFVLLTSAFCAGWFGMIKELVSYKETGNIEEDIKHQYLFLKNDFFASIPVYILQLLFYIILFSCFVFALFRLTDFVIGKPVDIISNLSAVSGEQADIIKFFELLPDESKILIFKRILFISVGNIIYFFLTMYSIPSLYFEKSNNPIRALFVGMGKIFKKPLFSVGLFSILVFANFILHVFETISSVNQLTMFIALVLRVYFMAFVVVLIFSVYENQFFNNSDNGSDCIGQDGTCN